MGNTILAHVLFASGQTDFDVDNFFSSKGDAHNISRYNHTDLVAHHLLEFPDSDLTCVLQIISTGWDEILRTKMSYSKWHQSTPSLHNYMKFFQNSCRIDRVGLWNEFYDAIKDASWPACTSPDALDTLPVFIQQEIDQKWTEPHFRIDSEYQLFEFLTTCYFDELALACSPTFQCPTYQMGDYLMGRFDALENLCSTMAWDWNQSRSQHFYHSMIGANEPYLAWLDEFKKQYDHSIRTNQLSWHLEIWELSLLIAKIFSDHGHDPRAVKWQNSAAFFDNKSLQLNQLMTH